MDAYSIFPLDPAKIAWTTKIKPKWDVTKYTSASQGRRTLTHQEYPTWQFDISFPSLSAAEVDALLAFHMFCKGSWNPFFYKDYERRYADVVLKDNETYYYKANGLPLIIPLSFGGYTFGEPCYMADYVRVYRDGVEDTENFEVTSDNSGQLRVYLTDVETDEGTLQSTVITATYEYYYKVSFQDSITINQKFKDIYSASLTLETVKQAIADTGDNDIWKGDTTYNVTITQSNHQAITVKKIKNGSTVATYVRSFQIIGNYTIEVSVEAYEGYVTGDLYVDGVRVRSGTRLNVDHDVDIFVTPAEPGSTVYMNGTLDTGGGNNYYVFYTDSACTTPINKSSLEGVLQVIDVSGDGLPYWGGGILGESGNSSQRCNNILRADVSSIDVSHKTDFNSSMARCDALQRITGMDLWDPISATSFYNMFYECYALGDIGDISNWNLPSLGSTETMFRRTGFSSIDLHNWQAPVVSNMRYMFQECSNLKIVDLSGVGTTNITNSNNVYGMFASSSNVEYIIMDAQEVKFGTVIFSEPNNTVKYLVPANMVAQYKAHANWSGRASRIVSIDDYTITRNNGRITVTENG